jgi:hypothetical protein
MVDAPAFTVILELSYKVFVSKCNSNKLARFSLARFRPESAYKNYESTLVS